MFVRLAAVHYVNPKIVVGCVPEKDGRDLAVQTRDRAALRFLDRSGRVHGAGRINRAGSGSGNAGRGLREVEIGHSVCVVDVVDAGQVHMFYTAKLLGDYAAGEESLDVAMYSEAEMPWDDIAFHSGRFALQKYFRGQGREQRRAYSRAAPRSPESGSFLLRLSRRQDV